MKKVSIIVPVYNVEEYLDECLETLVNQTLEEIEIIVVNDGTQDNSQTIIDRYASKYPHKLTGYIKPNGGVADARNYGIEKSTGEYLGFVDSDDYVDITMFEKLYKAAREEDADIATCGHFNINESKDALISKGIVNIACIELSAESSRKQISNVGPFVTTKLIRRKLFEDNGILFPKGMYYEDLAIAYNLLAASNKIVNLDEELYFYRSQRAGSTTNTYSERRAMTFDALELMCQGFIKSGRFEEYRDELQIIALRYTYYRFNEFYKYENDSLQSGMISSGFRLLNKYFPGWKKAEIDPSLFKLNYRVPDYIDLYKKKRYWKKLIRMSLSEREELLSEIKMKMDPSAKLRQYYSECLSTTKVDRGTILLESGGGAEISGEILEIMKTLSESDEYELFCSTDEAFYDANSRLIESNKLRVQLVDITSREYYKLLATAQYLINDHAFPDCYVRRKVQDYLYIWNGTPKETAGRNVRRGIASIAGIQHNLLQSSGLVFPDEAEENAVLDNYDLKKLFTGLSIVNKGTLADLTAYILKDKTNDNLKITDYSFNREIIRRLVVQEKSIIDKSEYDKFINENNGEDVVFAIKTKHLNQLVSRWFYEEYNDKVTYIVYNYCRLATAEEEKLWEENDNITPDDEEKRKLLIREIKKRGYRRSLPHLKFSNKMKIKHIL